MGTGDQLITGYVARTCIDIALNISLFIMLRSCNVLFIHIANNYCVLLCLVTRILRLMSVQALFWCLNKTHSTVDYISIVLSNIYYFLM